MQEYNLRPSRKGIEIVRPVLQHAFPLWQVFRAVVGTAYLVAFTVRKLTLDHVRVEAGFIENSRGNVVAVGKVPELCLFAYWRELTTKISHQRLRCLG